MSSWFRAEIMVTSKGTPGHDIESMLRRAEQEDLDHIALLADIVYDDQLSDQIRSHASWIFTWIGNSAREALYQVQQHFTPATRLVEVLSNKTAAFPELLETFQNGSITQRVDILDNEDFYYTREALSYIVDALHDENSQIRAAASWPLLLLARENIVGPKTLPIELLTKVLQSDLDEYRDPDVQVLMILDDAFRQMGLKPPEL